MKSNTSIKFKAAFLLAVFAMNTVVGFACSMGVDMGFNSEHHSTDKANAPLVHIHADGKGHIHSAKTTHKSLNKSLSAKAVAHVHNDGKRHLHTNQKGNEHRHNSRNDDKAKVNHEKGSDKDNCCSDKVRDFEQLEKAVPQVVKIVHPVFFTVFISSFYNIQLLPHIDIVKDIRQFVRSYHPPISDLRVAIQSFQI